MSYNSVQERLLAADALLPVIANQERYLLAERFTETSYAARLTYRVRGNINSEKLVEAIRATCIAHSILRTRFVPQGSSFAAIIDPEPPRIYPDEVQLDTPTDPVAIRRAFVDFFYRSTDVFTPESMVRAQIIRLPAEEAIVTLSLHHAISDGLSIRLFADEVYARYSGRPVEDSGPGYAEIMHATDESRADADSDYWRKRLAGVQTIPTLPPDRDMRLPRHERSMVERRIPYGPVMAKARAMGVTPFEMMTALSHVSLARLTGQNDMVLTFQSAGRRRHKGSRRAIGPFSNTVVLRAAVDPAVPFSDFAMMQKTAIAEAILHENCPYHRVITETGVRPEFGLNWYPPQPAPQIAGVTVIGREFVYLETDFDLDMRFVAEDEVLTIYAIYDPGRHSPSRIAALLDDLLAALARVTETPDLALGEIFAPPLPLTVPAPAILPEGRLYDAVLSQARLRPERVALIAEGREITYGELERASRNIALRLLEAGMGPGSRIAILAERGPALVWSILAVLRIGATMVPLDSEYPEARLRQLVEVARPDALLVPRHGQKPSWAEGVPHVIAVRDAPGPLPPENDFPANALAAGDPDAPAYILFTSGSTGTPKAVATSHRPALNFLQWQRKTFGIGEDDRFTNLNGVAHDMMIRDIFAPLSIGGQLIIPRQKEIFQPGFLIDWVIRTRPTILHLTPAMGSLITAAHRSGQRIETLRAMFFGGDRLLPELTRKMAALAPAAQIVNFYGATETPQAAGFHICDPDANWQSQPIGRGIDNMILRLVGPDHEPVPPGCPGEIAVLSPFLSLGYAGPAGIQPHATPGIYFTGDTGFELPSGEIMFTGRQDDQVSIRGFRVEMGEIARTLADHSAVEQAVVLMDRAATPAKLVAFAAGHELDKDELYVYLGRHLPDYMVPRDIVTLPQLPLLPNGKVDRQALLRIPRDNAQTDEVRQPLTEAEELLAAAWAKALGVKSVDTAKSFAQMRGDSLSYVEILLATESIVGSLPEGWETMPLARIAGLGSSKKKQSAVRQRIKFVDSALLIRAVAIVSIVAFHFRFFHIIGGGTTALFLVSGYLMGRFQIQQSFQSRSAEPIFRLAWNVFLPLVLFTVLLPIHGMMDGDRIPLPYLLMYSDFIAMNDNPPEGIETAVHLWYVHAMLHMLVMIGVLLWFNFRWHIVNNAKMFVILLFIFALLLRFVFPAAFVPNYFAHGIDTSKAPNFLPTAHLATVVLGMGFAFVTNLRERITMLVVMLIYIGLSVQTYHMSGPILMLTFGIFVLFIPRIPLPAFLQRLILVISGSSLFIYLTHGKLGTLFVQLGGEKGSFLQWVTVIGAGVLLWYCWQRLYPIRRVLENWIFSGRNMYPGRRKDETIEDSLSSV